MDPWNSRHSRVCKRFPVMPGFSYTQVPFKKIFTVYFYPHANRFLILEAATSHKKKHLESSRCFRKFVFHNEKSCNYSHTRIAHSETLTQRTLHHLQSLYWQNLYNSSCRPFRKRLDRGIQYLHTFHLSLKNLKAPETGPYLNPLNFVWIRKTN